MYPFVMPLFHPEDVCEMGGGIQIPAPEEYFEECAGQVRPFAFMGKAASDSMTHQYRYPERFALGFQTAGLLLVRVTDLLFTIPGCACFMRARYREEVNRKQRVQDGDDFFIGGEARWMLEMVVGWKHGKSWVYDESDPQPQVLNLAREFLRTETGAFVPQLLSGSDLVEGAPVCDPITQEAVAFDAEYRIALGEAVYPGNEGAYVSPMVFAEAVRALGELVLPYAREGKLGSEHEPSWSVSSLPPWQEFSGAETDYWVDSYSKVAALFHVPPRRASFYQHESSARRR